MPPNKLGMAYEVVARRWRPLTFDSVVGQKHVTATLASAIEQKRVAHAFLFTGIRGVGKTTVARLLARALNCSDRKGSEPCNACGSCTQILAGASVDVLEIDGASNRGIDEVRALIDAAAYRPAASPYRIYIIDEVHQLSRDAFNALLKILEEPPSHVKFVFATTEAHKIPQTVLSRCQRYDFRRLSADEIAKQLALVVKKDKLEVSKDALALLAREADGSMRDAQSLLEQVVAATGGNVDAAKVSEVLGIAGTELVVTCLEAILAREPGRVVEVMTEVRDGGYDAERFLNEVMELLRHTTVARAAGTGALGDAVPEVAREAVGRLKDMRDPLDLQRIFGSLLRTGEDVRRASLPEMVLEMGLLKAAFLDDVASVAEVLARLERSDGGGRTSSGSQDRQPAARGESGGSRTSGSSTRTAEHRSEPARSTDARATTQATAASSAPSTPASTPIASTTTTIDEPPSPAHASTDPNADPSEAGRWEGFLQFVRDEAGFDLYVTLSNCELVRFETERIELRAMLDSFRRRLESSDTLKRLRELANQHFGHAVDVGLAGSGTARGGNGGLSAHSIEADRTTKLEERALSDPLVQTAVTVLGGKVGKISRIDD